ncbi:MAG TPA: hypothetical protein VJO72_12965 [Candidatus Dormibacteraeota bacterium]|nr:hypothetical protein [Candidatus Dormibacteraeota bacterium]
MLAWPREPSDGIRRALIGMVVLLWVAAIVLAVVALTRPSPPQTSLRPASPPLGASPPPATPGPSISSANPRLVGVLPRTGPASANYPPGEPPGDVEDDTAPPSRSAPAPANPTAQNSTVPTLPVASSAPVPSPATQPTSAVPTLPPLPVPSIGP